MLNKIVKRIGICFVLCLFLMCFFMQTVYAAEQKETTEQKEITEQKIIRIRDIEKYKNKALSIKNDEKEEIVITDPDAIKELAEVEGFPEVEKIKKLTYTVGQISSEEPHSMLVSRITSKYVIKDVVNHGTGFKLVGHFDENRYQGPLSATYTYTRSDTCTFNADVAVSASLVSSKVGFTIGSSITKSDSVTINVPSGKRIILKVWTNYQKKSFKIYKEYNNSQGLLYYEGSGNAYKPVGLIFTQAEY